MIAGYVGRVFFYDSIAAVIIGSTVVSVGTAIAYAAMPTLIMGAVPITETASANGLEQPGALDRHLDVERRRRRRPHLGDHDGGAARLPSFEAFQDVFWMAGAGFGRLGARRRLHPAGCAAHRPAVPAGAAAASSWSRAASWRRPPPADPRRRHRPPDRPASRWTGAGWTPRATTRWRCPAPASTSWWPTRPAGRRWPRSSNSTAAPSGRTSCCRIGSNSAATASLGGDAGCRRRGDAAAGQRRACGHHAGLTTTASTALPLPACRPLHSDYASSCDSSGDGAEARRRQPLRDRGPRRSPCGGTERRRAGDRMSAPSQEAILQRRPAPVRRTGLPRGDGPRHRRRGRRLGRAWS